MCNADLLASTELERISSWSYFDLPYAYLPHVKENWHGELRTGAMIPLFSFFCAIAFKALYSLVSGLFFAHGGPLIWVPLLRGAVAQASAVEP